MIGMESNVKALEEQMNQSINNLTDDVSHLMQGVEKKLEQATFVIKQEQQLQSNSANALNKQSTVEDMADDLKESFNQIRDECYAQIEMLSLKINSTALELNEEIQNKLTAVGDVAAIERVKKDVKDLKFVSNLIIEKVEKLEVSKNSGDESQGRNAEQIEKKLESQIAFRFDRLSEIISQLQQQQSVIEERIVVALKSKPLQQQSQEDGGDCDRQKGISRTIESRVSRTDSEKYHLINDKLRRKASTSTPMKDFNQELKNSIQQSYIKTSSPVNENYNSKPVRGNSFNENNNNNIHNISQQTDSLNESIDELLAKRGYIFQERAAAAASSNLGLQKKDRQLLQQNRSVDLQAYSQTQKSYEDVKLSQFKNHDDKQASPLRRKWSTSEKNDDLRRSNVSQQQQQQQNSSVSAMNSVYSAGDSNNGTTLEHLEQRRERLKRLIIDNDAQLNSNSQMDQRPVSQLNSIEKKRDFIGDKPFQHGNANSNVSGINSYVSGTEVQGQNRLKEKAKREPYLGLEINQPKEESSTNKGLDRPTQGKGQEQKQLITRYPDNGLADDSSDEEINQVLQKYKNTKVNLNEFVERSKGTEKQQQQQQQHPRQQFESNNYSNNSSITNTQSSHYSNQPTNNFNANTKAKDQNEDFDFKRKDNSGSSNNNNNNDDNNGGDEGQYYTIGDRTRMLLADDTIDEVSVIVKSKNKRAASKLATEPDTQQQLLQQQQQQLQTLKADANKNSLDSQSFFYTKGLRYDYNFQNPSIADSNKRKDQKKQFGIAEKVLNKSYQSSIDSQTQKKGQQPATKPKK